ncbi:NADPH2:quinone reductase [Salinihabitans flavidus]|uniref:NADPH2:quinone reductase n=1 Tax=Salinihabitans flavidus TaxID=569882 RepID=A0A1H8UPT8_9RHOB|nr:NADPH:quinone oxidoreductase family protein [Salinihabitans flavidus]SEP05126.1 NADPH2:quinone reductase [Salinihabitans flavidus]
MKALLSETPGGPETLLLKELPTPEPGEGQVRVKVRAVGVNFPDLLIIKDQYQFKPERPFSPGAELAGVVDAVGPEVTGLSVGDRVMALPLWGGMRGEVCVRADLCHKLPDDVSFEQAAALQMTYGTSLYGLEARGGLTAGETLLVLGAAGGVGLAAVELGHALGARVIAAVSSEEKRRVAMEHGAEDGVVYPGGPLDRDDQKALSSAFREKLGKSGADVIFDTVGGDYTEPALRSVAWLGRYLIVGFPAGIAKIPANLPLLKSCDIRGVFWGAAVERDNAGFHRDMDRLLGLLGEGRLNPRIHASYPLEKAGDAIAELSTRGIIGKVIVTLG